MSIFNSSPDFQCAASSDRLAALQSYLHSIGANLPPPEFVLLVSSLYHQYEAETYDSRHPEIFRSEVPYHWRTMIKALDSDLPPLVSVLDFGCGTGFAAKQIIEVLTPRRIGRLLCVDPSSEMLTQCQENLANVPVPKDYVVGFLDSIETEALSFDLVVTNSVLHHIFDLENFLKRLGCLIEPRGFYIAGHEPSSRFTENSALRSANALYKRFHQLRDLFRFQLTSKKLLRKIGVLPRPKSIYEQVNAELAKNRAIRHPLDPGAISKMVDVHVPNVYSDLFEWGLRGLDPTWMLRYLAGFEIKLHSSYQHIKAYSRLSPVWSSIERTLRARYPLDGANFITVYQKLA